MYGDDDTDINNNNNNNNNNIYYLHFSCHPVAVVILHEHKYEISDWEFKCGGLHEKRVVVTGGLGDRLRVRL
jgi:hypothetical protein